MHVPATEPSKTSRNQSIELLRLMFMFLIILMHYILHGLGYYMARYDIIDNTQAYPMEMGLLGITHIGVTGFMFISGYFGIRFKWEKLFALWRESAFYLLVISLILIAIAAPSGKIAAVALFYLPFSTGGWWFLGCYFLVYLLSPLLEAGIRGISQKQFLCILILLFIYLYIGSLCVFSLSTKFDLLLFVYLLGRYIKLHNVTIASKHLIQVSAIGLILLFAIPWYLACGNHNSLLSLFFSNYNPLVLVTSVSIVLATVKVQIHNLPKGITSLLQNTLAIYLISDYAPLRDYLINHYMPSDNHFLPVIIGSVCLIMVACLLIEEFRKRIIDPLTSSITTHVQRMMHNLSDKIS